jgi:chromosome segregation ATPase
MPTIEEVQAELKTAKAENKTLTDRVEAMDAKVTEVLDEKKAEQRKREKAEKDAAKAAKNKATADGDTEALNKSWQEKFDKREEELQGKIDKRDGWIDKSTKEVAANTLANSITIEGSAKTVLSEIRSRIGVEIHDGKPRAVVLDKEGKPSATTVEELGKEIAADPAYAPVIIASMSSGGGAKGGHKGDGGAGTFKRGDLGGDKADRVAALKQRFPDLPR